jgi:hypothetical protein
MTMDIGSVKPVLAGVTSPVPKTPTEQLQSATTDLKAEKAVKAAENVDGSAVEAASGKREGQGGASAHALTAANTIKAASLDQTSGFEVQETPDAGKSAEGTGESSATSYVAPDSQEFAMRMQAMIEAWQGTGGTPRSAVFDQKL